MHLPINNICHSRINGPGNRLVIWVQGCKFNCKGCFNPETWDFEDGNLYTEKTKKEIIEAISANGIQRNFSILGGEPLALYNLKMTKDIIHTVRAAYPSIKIFLWTGYSFENRFHPDIFKDVDVIIDGEFIEDLKNLDLKFRGSSNQRIWVKEGKIWKVQND